MRKVAAESTAELTGISRRMARKGAAVAALLWGACAAAQTPHPPLPGLTPKEARADAVWTMRAGLNVAALQCQFSPFLATVPTYNALLRQHSDELADSFKVMTGYFVRTKGAKAGQRAFDSYATRTNQSWSTFDAQYSFCNAAAMTARHALGTPKGKFGDFAVAELPPLRASLAGDSHLMALAPKLEWAVVPTVSNPCKGRPPERCR
jgi:hypothetical protein